MTEALRILAMVGVLCGFVALLWWVVASQRRTIAALQQKLAAFGAPRGLVHVEKAASIVPKGWDAGFVSGARVQGRVGAATVCVYQPLPSRGGRRATHVLGVGEPIAGKAVALLIRGKMDRVTRFFMTAAPVATGDARFDEAFELYSEDPHSALAFASPAVRSAALSLLPLRQWTNFVCYDARVVMLLLEGWEADPSVLDAAVLLVTAACSAAAS